MLPPMRPELTAAFALMGAAKVARMTARPSAGAARRRSASRHQGEEGSTSAAGVGASTTARGSNARGARSSASLSAREDDAVAARRTARRARARRAPTIAAPMRSLLDGAIRLGARRAAGATRRGATTRGRNAADAARTFVMGRASAMVLEGRVNAGGLCGRRARVME